MSRKRKKKRMRRKRKKNDKKKKKKREEEEEGRGASPEINICASRAPPGPRRGRRSRPCVLLRIILGPSTPAAHQRGYCIGLKQAPLDGEGFLLAGDGGGSYSEAQAREEAMCNLEIMGIVARGRTV